MAFKGLQTFEERHAAHIRPEVLALAKREAPVTVAEYEAGRWNSYEWHILAPRLNDEAFAQYAAHNIANCYRGDRSVPYAIYDDALVGFVAPELLRRWRATFEEKASAQPTPPPDTLTLSRAEAERILRVMGSSERQVSEGLCALVERIEAFLYPKKEA